MDSNPRHSAFGIEPPARTRRNTLEFDNSEPADSESEQRLVEGNIGFKDDFELSPLTLNGWEQQQCLSSPIDARLSRRRNHFSGWRFGARLAAICASSTFAFNLIATISGIAATHPFRNGSLGLGTVFEGNCATAKKVDVWVHLAINILSRSPQNLQN